MNSPRATLRLTVTGLVQGVGFRPYLHRLAKKYRISGWARNTTDGLEGFLSGTPEDLSSFLRELRESPPPLASIEAVRTVPAKSIAPEGGSGSFRILDSQVGVGYTLVSPDIATCPRCQEELRDPKDRRYRYPFINCTDCGPRYTIIRSLPYDRKRTVMDDFPMCGACEAEYNDIGSRRYHAQPDCCPDCGPHVFFIEGTKKNFPGNGHVSHEGGQTSREQDPFRPAQELLRGGGILAVKGIGGIHLACDALNADAVRRLRQRKHRPEKPLALMCASLDAVRRICHVTPREERLLLAPARPIVLLAKKDPDAFPELSFSSRLGVMLPYTPLHILLLDGTYDGPDTVVMTSGNIPGCPVLTENEEALEALREVADGFLLHNRKIQNRCDDSLAMEWRGHPYFLRRSRGYVPRPVRLPDGGIGGRSAEGIFAMGAELKASFALGRENEAFLSPYIGDLKNAETAAHYQQALETYRCLFRLSPSLYVCDLHPDYLSTRLARQEAGKAGLPLLPVQHHWAHMASCMADNHLEEPCFGIIWDGTGLGTDGSIWGCEFLEGDFARFTRKGSLRPIALPGGDRAVVEIGRTALSLLADAKVSPEGLVPWPEEKRRILTTLASSPLSPRASSAGRLFDGVCALLLGRTEVSYDGEGPALVEALSPSETPAPSDLSWQELSYTLSFYTESREGAAVRIFDFRPMIREMVRDIKGHVSPGHIALRFMITLCCMAQNQCSALNRNRLPVILSGGVFQNRFLLAGITSLLEERGFRVYTHRQVSPGDEGICLGQLAIAMKKRRNE